MAGGTLEPMVVSDLDHVNMFGNVGWPSFHKALHRHFSDLRLTDWQHRRTVSLRFPQAPAGATNRGAEQGDVFGTITGLLHTTS